MLIYLDINIVIYLVEQPAVWGPRAAARVAAALSGGDQLAVSDLHRLECRVGPLTAGNAPRLAQFDAFFGSASVQVFALSAMVCERAAAIRANHRFRPLDALHLSAAAVGGCGRFVTNDVRLSTFPDVTVEIL